MLGESVADHLLLLEAQVYGTPWEVIRLPPGPAAPRGQNGQRPSAGRTLAAVVAGRKPSMSPLGQEQGTRSAGSLDDPLDRTRSASLVHALISTGARSLALSLLHHRALHGEQERGDRCGVLQR
jgi:hypothetical protein